VIATVNAHALHQYRELVFEHTRGGGQAHWRRRHKENRPWRNRVFDAPAIPNAAPILRSPVLPNRMVPNLAALLAVATCSTDGFVSALVPSLPDSDARLAHQQWAIGSWPIARLLPADLSIRFQGQVSRGSLGVGARISCSSGVHRADGLEG